MAAVAVTMGEPAAAAQGAPVAVPAANPPVAHVAAPAPLDIPDKGKIACLLLGIGLFLTVVLVPSSLEKVSSTEVGYAYDSVWCTLHPEQLGEGLNSIPTFGHIIKWPTSNQAVDLSCQCNSKDAIQIDIECDFLYVPMSARTLNLTHVFKDFEEYDRIITMVARSSVRNACGDFTALEFQTLRDTVQRDMERKVADDLRAKMSAEVLTLNLRNIERPNRYAQAVNKREEARADIDLAIFQRKQQIVAANTGLQEAALNANKTLDTAKTLAEVRVTFAEAAYNATIDRYQTYARVLSAAQQQHSLSTKGVLSWHGNELAQSAEHVALNRPSQFSFRDEL